MKRSVRLLFAAGVAVLTLTLGLALAACGGDGDDSNGAAPTATEAAALATPTEGAATTPEDTGGATTLKVELGEFTISRKGGAPFPHWPAGEVLFEVQNVGAVPHEFVIIKTATDPATFPASGGKVDEEAVGELIGEVEELPAGETETSTFGLQPGTYALICNIAGHYEQGMYAQLTVE